MNTDKGIPTILETDGGTQFALQAFSNFCRQWGIHHVLSSSHHHEANGAAEAAVKAMKALVAKTTTTTIGRIDVDEFRSGLLEFRHTPRAHGFSPAQLLYGRTIRSQLLTYPTALKQDWREQRNALDKVATSLMAKAKTQHDEHARPLSILAPGAVVRVQHPRNKQWDTIAEVIERKPSGRSYAVKTESGWIYWRNHRILRLYLVS